MEQFTFNCEWRDSSVNLAKPLQLILYPEDSTLEIADAVNRKHFLKRLTAELPDTVVPGGQVVVLGRTLDIIDYADDFTRRNWQQRTEKIVVLVNDTLGDLFAWMKNWFLGGWKLMQAKMCLVDEERAQSMGCDSGVYFVMQWQGNEISNHMKIFRESLGESVQRNVVINPQVNLNALPCATVRKNTTCVIIKPHVFAANNKKALTVFVLEDIVKAGFTITDIAVKRLHTRTAEEFLEIYRTVLPDFSNIVGEMASGPFLVLEVICKGNTVEEFRKLAGPHDPELARRVRPNSLRAKYGETLARNGIHCSDLEEDGQLEVEFMFDLTMQ